MNKPKKIDAFQCFTLNNMDRLRGGVGKVLLLPTGLSECYPNGDHCEYTQLGDSQIYPLDSIGGGDCRSALIPNV